MIETAQDAAKLSAEKETIEVVMGEIQFAAGKGFRSWVFNWLPDETRAELQRRGFCLEGTGYHTTVRW